MWLDVVGQKLKDHRLKNKKMQEERELKQIRDLNEKLIDESEKAHADAEENRKKKILMATEVAKTLETPGGKFIQEQIQTIIKLWEYKPTQLFTPADAQGYQKVNDTLVAQLGGGIQAMEGLQNWFTECYNLIKVAADENTEKQNQENNG